MLRSAVALSAMSDRHRGFLRLALNSGLADGHPFGFLAPTGAASRREEPYLITGGGTRNETRGSASLAYHPRTDGGFYRRPAAKRVTRSHSSTASTARRRGHTGFRIDARGGTCSDSY